VLLITHSCFAHLLYFTIDMIVQAFAAVREMYGVDSASYMNSVCGDFNFIQFIANSRSGQFFFYSHDGKYMIKTQTKEENKFLRRILPHYFRHMAKNPDSMVRLICCATPITCYRSPVCLLRARDQEDLFDASAKRLPLARSFCLFFSSVMLSCKQQLCT